MTVADLTAELQRLIDDGKGDLELYKKCPDKEAVNILQVKEGEVYNPIKGQSFPVILI